MAFGCGSSSTETPPQARQSAEADGTIEPAEPSPATTDSNDAENNSVSTQPTQPAARLDRSETIAKATELAAENNFPAAVSELQKLLLADPADYEVVFRLANMTAKSGDLSKAIALLSEIPSDHPEAGLPALGQSAEWCNQLKRYDEAEERYLKLLELAPKAAPALRQLAYILNRQGRRHEAAVYIRRLCELGNVRQDELHSLISVGDAMYDDPAKPQLGVEGSRPYWPIGVLAQARRRFNDEQFADAVSLLHESVADGSAKPAAVALYGLAAAESQDDPRLQWWLSQTDESTRWFAEYWTALGIYLLTQQKHEQAARAFAEAIDRDPTDLRAISRLRQTLLALEENEDAQLFVQQWKDVRETILINNRIAGTNPPAPGTISELVTMLQDLDRPLEALLWKAIEQHYTGAPDPERLQLNQQRGQLVVSGKMFPTTQQRLCGLSKEQFPLPEIESAKRLDPPTVSQSSREPTPAKFVNVASELGLNHTYQVASRSVGQGYAVYQMLGGGVAVIDYDRDGHCDLYFAQGGSDPPAFKGQRTNQLYRYSGPTFIDTTKPAGVAVFQYTIGVTAGDWNQDGFADLAMTNIGADVLLLNNGDGTFSRRPIEREVNKNRAPSSVAIADLTGDGLPDLFQANYVDDPRMVMKPPTNNQGQPLQPILPSKFSPSADRLIENDGTGAFSVNRLTPDSTTDTTSLGLIVTNFDDKPGVEVFVANDMKPNQLWMRSPSKEWMDVAPLRGCAFSYTGASTASMGVAAADFENNGTIDLHITNYERENVSLFLNINGAFQDRNIQYRLSEPSRDVLGFGTQAIDYDNDGRRDLVVANGHIEDAVENTTPFKQLPQLFCNLNDHFAIASVDDSSNYWNTPHIGRGMASLDINRDGLLDVAITHIEEPSALLVNQTPNDHHWLQLQLVGTKSERDSIGASVRVRVGEQSFTDWVIAGDGYLCNNEDIVCFGLGNASQVSQVEVTWPSGDQQTFVDIPPDNRLLLVEGQRDHFVFELGN